MPTVIEYISHYLQIVLSKKYELLTARTALKFGIEVWVLKKREERRLEAAQLKFLRHLLGITKLDKEKN